ncbi:hypothetical protein [Brevifollis gellanilyticus]|nr:hypothetical protein [Brevifollis gellanilyticus]
MKVLPVCFAFAIMAWAALAAPPQGSWIAPDATGKPWFHEPTGLTFPTMLGTHRLAGEFRYEQGGGRFIRYESLDERSRADIFFFPIPSKNLTMEEKQRLILQEMDNVVKDLDAMTKEGRYRKLKIGEIGVGGIELWDKEAIPMAARICEMTRVAKSDLGVEEEVPLKQWTGIILLDSYVITIRQMRPVTPADNGEAGFQAFAQMVAKIIKDPPLRKGVIGLIDRYLADPFSDDSVHATAAVLAYLKTTTDLPINIPEYPIQGWLEHCKKVAPGTEEQLLSAFMLGSAKVAFAGGDAAACLNAGATQFAKVYRQLLAKHPEITLPQIDAFLAAATESKGGEWLLRYSSSGK